MGFHGGGKVVKGKIFQNFCLDLVFEVILFCAFVGCVRVERGMYIFPSSLFFVSFSFNVSSYVL